MDASEYELGSPGQQQKGGVAGLKYGVEGGDQGRLMGRTRDPGLFKSCPEQVTQILRAWPKRKKQAKSLLFPPPLGLDASNIPRFFLSPLAEAPSRQQSQPLVEIQSHLLPAAGAPTPRPPEALGTCKSRLFSSPPLRTPGSIATDATVAWAQGQLCEV